MPLSSGFGQWRNRHCPGRLSGRQPHLASAPSGTEPQKIANWDVAAQKLRSSIAAVQEGAREVRGPWLTVAVSSLSSPGAGLIKSFLRRNFHFHNRY